MAARGQDGDWFEQNAPPPAQGQYVTQDGFYQQINALYQQYYGREASMGEIDAHRGNPGGAGAVEAMLKASAPAPAAVTTPAGNTNPGGTTGGGTANRQIGVPTSGFGAAPSTYASDPNAPVYTQMPTYTAPEWTGGDFVNPTMADVEGSAGYQTRLNDRLQGQARRYAAGGTILNGGTLKALDRSAQDYATNEYQTYRGNSLDAYKQRYSQFQDKAGMDLGARTLNAAENQNSYQNRATAYLQGNNRTLSDYLTNLTAKRNSELDYWSRLQDVNQTGAGLAGGSR